VGWGGVLGRRVNQSIAPTFPHPPNPTQPNHQRTTTQTQSTSQPHTTDQPTETPNQPPTQPTGAPNQLTNQPEHPTNQPTNQMPGKPAGDDKKLMKELGSTFREEGLSLLQQQVWPADRQGVGVVCVSLCLCVRACRRTVMPPRPIEEALTSHHHRYHIHTYTPMPSHRRQQQQQLQEGEGEGEGGCPPPSNIPAAASTPTTGLLVD
jgi:hypothetical protein